MDKFVLHSDYTPTGDQPQAIEKLTRGVNEGMRSQVLLGVTGSGKTFTMANVIANVNRPTLVLAHNKTLAAQLCTEFREFFPENAVEYFVSYYDYYQPEAYIPGKDIYIEKDAMINDEIDKLRHSATSALFERRDVIIVSSVSCIYSLGDPAEYKNLVIPLRPGMQMERNELLRKLTAIRFDRNDISLERNKFRVRGDTVEIYPSSSDGIAVRVEFFGDEIDALSEIEVTTGKIIRRINYAGIYPASHYAVSEDKMEGALAEIEKEAEERAEFFRSQGKLIEAQRISERTAYDIAMLREVGYCSGVENYSRILSGRAPGSTPYTLLDYFPEDFLLFVDESHVTLPQVRAMSGGDRARKENLVEFGYRLPSAFDNRPLFYNEFQDKLNQVICVSATPAEYEKNKASQIVEQIIRPTGLLDPEVEIRPIENQIDDVMGEIRERAEKGERTLVTTLTTTMAEDLTEYLSMNLIKVKYIHHKVDTLERIQIIRDLRLGVFDCLVGVNLLREGLDMPEVSLVAILDADKEGLFRSETSLIQTIGRAARNDHGKVIMYADVMTGSLKAAVNETNRRRKIQSEYNKEHGITPHTIIKKVSEGIDISVPDSAEKRSGEKKGKSSGKKDVVTEKYLSQLEEQMRHAASELDFETAAALRDEIERLGGKALRRTRIISDD